MQVEKALAKIKNHSIFARSSDLRLDNGQAAA